jgi:hypothetical protein
MLRHDYEPLELIALLIVFIVCLAATAFKDVQK